MNTCFPFFVVHSDQRAEFENELVTELQAVFDFKKLARPRTVLGEVFVGACSQQYYAERFGDVYKC